MDKLEDIIKYKESMAKPSLRSTISAPVMSIQTFQNLLQPLTYILHILQTLITLFKFSCFMNDSFLEKKDSERSFLRLWTIIEDILLLENAYFLPLNTVQKSKNFQSPQLERSSGMYLRLSVTKPCCQTDIKRWTSKEIALVELVLKYLNICTDTVLIRTTYS